MDEGVGPGRWQDDLYDLLRRNDITQFAYVPDAGHRILIDRSLADPEVHSVALTSEEEGVAMLAGADLGGARNFEKMAPHSPTKPFGLGPPSPAVRATGGG
jgi:hypothetical protein